MVKLLPIGTALLGFAATLPCLLASPGSSHGSPSQDFAAVARPFLDQHCVRCHKDASAESKYLDLVSPQSIESTEGAPDWEWLLDQVEFADMPPPGEAAPTSDERSQFVTWLRSELGQSEAPELAPLPASGLRRLTSAQYENAILDTLGVRLDLSRILPEDAVGHSFDHVASAQSLSEAHFVRYLEAAELVVESALPLALLDNKPRTKRYFPEELTGGRGNGQGRLLWTNGEVETVRPLPSAGQYRVRAEVYGEQAGPDPCRARLTLGDTESERTFDVAATNGTPEIIEAVLRGTSPEAVGAGVRFVNDYYGSPAEGEPMEDRNFVVRWIEVEGPLDGGQPTPFMRRWELGPETNSEWADYPLEERVAQCAELLWRRPLASRESRQVAGAIHGGTIAQLLELSSVDESPAHRMRAALIGMLASPRFLFFVESADGDGELSDRGSLKVDTRTLLTRVALLLWRSIPDAALLEEYGRGTALTLPETVEHMLSDPRSDRFAESFVDQWLQLRSAGGKRADRRAFPDFDDRLRGSMLEETRRVFTASLRERRNLWELIDGTETIVNRRLAQHYGLGAEAFGTAGRLPRRDEWLEASLEGTSRRGLLGQAAILFRTSEASRTSPVSRGRWVLDVLLGSAPPPPPPGADNLAPQPKGAKALTLRERMDVHRAEPTCAACHARMDPIGFSLERYDAIGVERAVGHPDAVDLTGQLPDGRAFNGPVELAAVLREDDRFLEALAERLLVFGLGRGLERADRGAVQKILAGLDPENPTLEDMILSVVKLEEFTSIMPLEVETMERTEPEDAR